MVVTEEPQIDLATRDLLEELARRLDVAAGRVKVELIFLDGRLEDGYRHHRLNARALTSCICRHHAWNPGCPVHPPTESQTADS